MEKTIKSNFINNGIIRTSNSSENIRVYIKNRWKKERKRQQKISKKRGKLHYKRTNPLILEVRSEHIARSRANEKYRNGFIITWILHQIFMFSIKVKLAAG